MKTSKTVKDTLYWLYFQYLLVSCCIDMEPWERVLMNTIVATILIMLAITAYIFIPVHLRLTFRAFLQLLTK